MFGFISHQANTSYLVFTPPFHSHLSTGPQAIEQNHRHLRERMDAGQKWLGSPGPGDGWLYLALCTLCICLEADIQPYAVRSLAMHAQLPVAQRHSREELFRRTWDTYSPGRKDHTEWTRQNAIAKSVAMTYPTELIEAWTRLTCRWMWRQAVDRTHPETLLPDSPTFSALNARRDLQGLTGARHQALGDLLLTRPPGEAISTVNQLAALPADELRRRLDAMSTSQQISPWCDLGDYLLRVHLPDAWARALTDLAGNGSTTFAEALARHCTNAINGFLTQLDQLMRRTMEAVESGVDMGEPWNTQCRQALASWQNEYRRKALAWTAALRESVGTERQAPAPNPDNAQQAALQSWGIDQLVRWIDGPVTAPRTRAAVTRVKQQARHTEAAPEGDTARVNASAPATAASDMPNLLPLALSDSARFLGGELQDLSALASQLGQPEAIAPWLTEARQDLAAMAQATPLAPRDPEAEQALLTRVDEALEELRTRLRKLSAQIKLNERFGAELANALRAEKLALGKRQGGVIGCALPSEQWGPVYERYHQRLLPMCQSVAMGDGTLALGPDQALALYVTGSSQSGYAFDVSVHLWARRAGKTTPPSREQGAYPRMNTDDWFDTYQPCCVLHVPLAQ